MSFSFHRMMSDYKVETINDGITEFNVEFHGPKESNVMKILVSLCFFIDFVTLLKDHLPLDWRSPS